MSTFVLIPGAGGDGSYRYRVVPRAAGPQATRPSPWTCPVTTSAAGLPEYTELVLKAMEDREDVVLVALSMGAFTAPMVCARGSVGPADPGQRHDPAAREYTR